MQLTFTVREGMKMTTNESVRDMVAREEITPAHALSMAQRSAERAAHLSSLGDHIQARAEARLAADLYDWVMS